jgi:hypothetical protein
MASFILNFDVFLIFGLLASCWLGLFPLRCSCVPWLAGRRAVGYAMPAAVAEGAVVGAARAHPNHSAFSPLAWRALCMSKAYPTPRHPRGRMGWVRRTPHPLAGTSFVRCALGVPTVSSFARLLARHSPIRHALASAWLGGFSHRLSREFEARSKRGKRAKSCLRAFRPEFFSLPPHCLCPLSTGRTPRRVAAMVRGPTQPGSGER